MTVIQIKAYILFYFFNIFGWYTVIKIVFGYAIYILPNKKILGQEKEKEFLSKKKFSWARKKTK